MGDDEDAAETECHRRMVEAFTGGALGLFVGALLGLSVTPGTTTAVLGGLVALLAAFFGLVVTDKISPIRANNSRIIAFCLVGLVATVLAVYVRANDVLVRARTTPTTVGPFQALKDDLLQVGFKDEEIKRMIDTAYFSKESQKTTPVLPLYQPKPPERLPGSGGFLFEVKPKID